METAKPQLARLVLAVLLGVVRTSDFIGNRPSTCVGLNYLKMNSLVFNFVPVYAGVIGEVGPHRNMTAKYCLCPGSNDVAKANLITCNKTDPYIAMFALFDKNGECKEVHTEKDILSFNRKGRMVEIIFKIHDEMVTVLRLGPAHLQGMSSYQRKSFTNMLAIDTLEAQIFVKPVEEPFYELDNGGIFGSLSDNLFSIFFHSVSGIVYFYCTWFNNHMTTLCRRRPFDHYLIFFSTLRLLAWVDVIYRCYDSTTRSPAIFIPSILVYIFVPLLVSIYFERSGPVFTYKLIIPVYHLIIFVDLAFVSVLVAHTFSLIPILFWIGLHFLPSVIPISRKDEWSTSLSIVTELLFLRILTVTTRKYGAARMLWFGERLYIVDDDQCILFLVFMLLLLPLSYAKYRLSVWLTMRIENSLDETWAKLQSSRALGDSYDRMALEGKISPADSISIR